MTEQRLTELRRLATFMKGCVGQADELSELFEHIDELQKYKDTVEALEANKYMINNIEGPGADPQDRWVIWGDEDGPVFNNGKTYASGKTLQEAVLDMLRSHAQVTDTKELR